jgi:hypothetical protein
MKKYLAVAAMLPSLAFATAIDQISATLTGDIRDDNPEGIEIDVLGVQDGANEDTFNFSVNWGANNQHDSAHMQQFYITVDPYSLDSWEVTGISSGWTLEEEPTGGGGAGGVNGFLFGWDNDGQGANATPLPLEFVLIYLDGEIMLENFVDAENWTGGDGLEGQVGAKLGGLTVNDITCPQLGCGDSGFATAFWEGEGSGGGGGGGNDIPEPGSLALLSMGLVGLFVSRRKARR